MQRIRKFFKKHNLGVLLVIMMVLGALIYAKRKPREYFHYKGELFADQAGYYVYLPGAFIYNFDGSSFTEDFLKSTGYGFGVDSLSGKIITKYAVGVAIMQAPFFGIIHAHAGLTGAKQDGFSRNYHNVPNWSAWFYGSFGLWFFFLFLRKRVDKWLAALMLAIVFFGTSTYYYTADNSGMSHVYSFFLFSAFIYLFDIICSRGFVGWRVWLFGVLCGLIVAVRPVNLVFIPMATLYLLMLNKHDFQWVRQQISFWKILVVVFVGLSFMVPQFLYWKLTSGSFIYYSYGNEGFIYLKNPKLLEFWFSPLAGLFLYSPAYLLAVLAIFRKIGLRQNQVLLLGFIGFSYLMASWHVYYFGCSFGSRNLVEYSVLFFIPLGLWLNELRRRYSRMMKGMLLICSLYTLDLMASYAGCIYILPWEWEEFGKMATRGIYYERMDDEWVLPETVYKGISSTRHKHFTSSNFRDVDVHLKAEGYSDKTDLAFEVYKDSILQFASFNLVEESQKDEEGDMYYTFALPEEYPRDAVLKAYLINEGKDSIHIEKLTLWFR